MVARITVGGRRLCRGTWAALAGLTRSRRASTSLEFAIAGPAFLLMMIAAAELGFTLFAQSALDNAARASARLLQTNTAPKDGKGVQTVSICPYLSMFLDCSRVYVGLVPVGDFTTDGGLGPLIVNGAISNSATQVNAGQGSSLMLLRATYLAPALISQLVPGTAAALGGSTVYPVVSSVAFRNEF